MSNKYKNWKVITESLVGGGFTLGLSQPPKVGGLVGAQTIEEDFEDDDEDFEDDEDAEDDEDGEEEDLLGSEPEGPKKAFPPDDSEEMDGLPTPDEEMLGGEEGGEGGFEDELAANMGQAAPASDDDMDFLNDIDPALMGDDPLAAAGGEDPTMGDEFGADDFGGESGMDDASMGQDGEDLPCPECNPDGNEAIGDPDCQACGGDGFMNGADLEMGDEFSPEGGPDGMEGMEDMPMDDEPENMKLYMGKGCHEQNDFFNDLRHMMSPKKRIKREDSLQWLDDPAVAPTKPGDVGYAPQGRVGSFGGNHTQDDVQQIPVMESHQLYKLPSWKEWKAQKTNKSK